LQALSRAIPALEGVASGRESGRAAGEMLRQQQRPKYSYKVYRGAASTDINGPGRMLPTPERHLLDQTVMGKLCSSFLSRRRKLQAKVDLLVSKAELVGGRGRGGGGADKVIKGRAFEHRGHGRFCWSDTR
jgi:hypothetical protein